jgi:hypothetical protein
VAFEDSNGRRVSGVENKKTRAAVGVYSSLSCANRAYEEYKELMKRLQSQFGKLIHERAQEKSKTTHPHTQI